jgi:hypothetical protein
MFPRRQRLGRDDAASFLTVRSSCTSSDTRTGGDENMEYRQLGRSGLRVSRLTLGRMTFAGRGQFAVVGQTDLESARRQIDSALDAGINLIDTADIYSQGAAERSWAAR